MPSGICFDRYSHYALDLQLWKNSTLAKKALLFLKLWKQWAVLSPQARFNMVATVSLNRAFFRGPCYNYGFTLGLTLRRLLEMPAFPFRQDLLPWYQSWCQPSCLQWSLGKVWDSGFHLKEWAALKGLQHGILEGTGGWTCKPKQLKILRGFIWIYCQARLWF